MIKIEMIQVAAVIDGTRIRLIDKNGKPVPRCIKAELLGMPDQLTIEKMKWYKVIETQINHFSYGQEMKCDPWLNRAEAMRNSLRLRIKDLALKGKRRQCDEWKTKSWKEAALRMNEQAYRHFKTYLGCPWKRWAANVSKNHQRRVETRYGKNNYSVANI